MTPGATAGPVTLAVVNARVWTGDPRRPWADAVVVRGDRLAYVGSGAEARKLTRGAPDPQVIDARGQFLTASAAGPGVLRPGAPADFVLLDREPAPPAPDAAGDPAPAPRPVLVVRGGRVADGR